MQVLLYFKQKVLTIADLNHALDCDLFLLYYSKQVLIWIGFTPKFLVVPITISLFYKKINASVTKSSHRDHGLCYLQLPIFFLYRHSPLLVEKKVIVIAVFLSKLDSSPLFNDIYYEAILVWGLISIWLTHTTHCL